jgi:hypothetical protein
MKSSVISVTCLRYDSLIYGMSSLIYGNDSLIYGNFPPSFTVLLPHLRYFEPSSLLANSASLIYGNRVEPNEY